MRNLIIYTHTAPSGATNNKIEISLSTSCAKEVCMMSKKTNARLVRKYFIMMEKLVKDYIRNPKDCVLSFLCEEVKERINPRLKFADKYKMETKLAQEYTCVDVIYVYELHPDNRPGKRVFKYGVTDRFHLRGDEHRKRFNCECTLIKVVPTKATRSHLIKFEASLGLFTKRIGVREKYMTSDETFIIPENDTESIDEVLTFIEETIPDDPVIEKVSEHTPDLELKKLELELKKMDHEYRMMLLQIEIKKLELSS